MASRGISPESNGGVDLGSTSKRWRKLYAQTIEENADMGNNYSLGYRKPSTAYSVGDIVYTSRLATSRKLVCVKAGTTGSGDIPSFIGSEGQIFDDGTVKWAVDSLADFSTSARHANGFVRGANITNYFESGLLSENIANGFFVNVYSGDYIVKTVETAETTYTDKSGTEVTQAAATYENMRWDVAALDFFYKSGEGGTTDSHHVLMLANTIVQPDTNVNPTDTTAGGYLGSDMWTVQMPIWTSAVKAAFGADHVLTHREFLTNAVDTSAPSGAGAAMTGTTTGATWVDVDVNIPSESMLFGGRIFGSAYDSTQPKLILPLENFISDATITARFTYWTRTISDSGHFVDVTTGGIAGSAAASQGKRIRPYFLLY